MAQVNGTPLPPVPPAALQETPPPGYVFVDCVGAIIDGEILQGGSPALKLAVVLPNYIRIPPVLTANGAPSLDCHPHVGVRFCIHEKHIRKEPESDG
jgi:hypothetical protein